MGQTEELVDTENRLVATPEVGGEGWAKWVKGVKMYKPLAIK